MKSVPFNGIHAECDICDKSERWYKPHCRCVHWFGWDYKGCPKCVEGLKRATKSMGRIFWDSVERELNKKDLEDRSTITREQMILRGLYILHLEVEELKKAAKSEVRE